MVPAPTSRSLSSTGSSTSLTITQDQDPYEEDPNSRMADLVLSEWANSTYTAPAYVPAKIPAGVCVLWDPSCKGNKTVAANTFFRTTMDALFLDSCFVDFESTSVNCTSSLLNPADASLSTGAKSYMRQPQCTKDYYSVFGSAGSFDCCGPCWIYGPNVDVYYWPEPNSDTACLDIIGTSVVPLDEGAQTNAKGVIYWAASTNLYDIYVPTFTTALITTINGIVVKQALANPWDASPSMTTTRPVAVTSTQKASPKWIHPRAFNPLYVRERLELNNSVATGVTGRSSASLITGSTAVSDGFTFTSPSAYVAFYLLSASDMCGYRGQRINSTMLAFAPGELSTVQGHPLGGGLDGVEIRSTKVFNFLDLPCPPYSTMYSDWYKPAPGQPYRPLIALPDKVRSLDSLWTACTEAYYFTGLDPPRTLVAATEMLKPAVTAVDWSITPEPAQGVPVLPSITGMPLMPATGDPSGNENVAPNLGAVLQNKNPIAAGSHPTPTLKELDLQDGLHSIADIPVSAYAPAAILPAANSPANNAPATNGLVNASPTQSQLVAVPPASTVTTLQSGSSKEKMNPNDMSPLELSQLHQALQPRPSLQADAGPEPQTNGPLPFTRNQASLLGIPGQLVPKPANIIIMGSSTVQLPRVIAQSTPAQAPGMAATITMGSHIVVVNRNGVAVDGQHIQRNGAPVNIGGSPVQVLDPAADSDPGLSDTPDALQLPQGSSPSLATVAGLPVVNNQGIYLVHGTPLAPGSVIAISGTTWSLASQGPSNAPSLNIGGKAYYLLNVTTVSGTQMSLNSGGDLIVGTRTLPLGSTNVDDAATMTASTLAGSAVSVNVHYLALLGGILLVAISHLL